MGDPVSTTAAAASDAASDYFRIALANDFGLTVHVNMVVVLALLLALGALLAIRHYFFHRLLPEFEIEEAEFGLGDQKIILRANDLDRTVAYRVWVELSTRKIGLKIDPDDDVIDEIYNSWYEFFAVTRELIKDVPVAKVRQDSTRKIIQLSIEVLNTGLRPHLTKWQARFRRWYTNQLLKDGDALEHPQDIQKRFPDYDKLIAEMLEVNKKLMAYREKMYVLVTH
ncbi:MAG: hypothetical protein ABII76_00525 [Pseudomonadota bacterium]